MSTKDMEWLVASRSKVQELLLVLWHIAKDHPPKKTSLKLQHQLLIATCFALWRAVFLAHGDRAPSKIDADAIKFLETLVRDNAIAYTQDRESKAWTFGYYVNDAYFRLDYYHRTFHPLPDSYGDRIAEYLRAQGNRYTARADAQIAWTDAYDAARHAANALASAV